MEGLRRSATLVLCFVLTVVVLWVMSCSPEQTPTEETTAEEAPVKLSDTRYVDPKGYFTIVPPDGWEIQEYPDDPRGKVAFKCPGSQTDLRVLINIVDYDDFDQLVQQLLSKEEQLGVETNLEETTFGDIPAVERDFGFQGIRLRAIDFLVGRVAHNLQYGAPEDEYDTYLFVALKSMETYEPVFKDVTDEDQKKSIVAKKVRLAELMLEAGNLDVAAAYVEEGLEISPKDAKLLALKQQIEEQRSKE